MSVLQDGVKARLRSYSEKLKNANPRASYLPQAERATCGQAF